MRPFYGPTIAVIDDDPSIRRFVGHVLRHAGYDAVVAGSAVEGKDAIRARAGKVSLVMCDIRMPGASGLDLAVELENTWPGMPILFISGLVDSIAVEGILLAKPQAILMKPFTADELLARVGELLDTTLSRSLNKLAVAAIGPARAVDEVPEYANRLALRLPGDAA